MGMALTQLKARFFPTTRSTTIFIGTNPLTRLLATDLDAAGRPVAVINMDTVARANGNALDDLVLARAGKERKLCYRGDRKRRAEPGALPRCPPQIWRSDGNRAPGAG